MRENQSQGSSRRGARANGGKAPSETAEAIKASLKAHYDDLVQAPLPDRFLDLLAQLETREIPPKKEDGHDA